MQCLSCRLNSTDEEQGPVVVSYKQNVWGTQEPKSFLDTRATISCTRILLHAVNRCRTPGYFLFPS